MSPNDPVEIALTRRPSDEREYDEPLAPLTEPATGKERLRPVVRTRIPFLRRSVPALAGLCLIFVLGAGLLAFGLWRGPAANTGNPNDFEPSGRYGCFGQGPGEAIPAFATFNAEATPNPDCPPMVVPPSGYGPATWTLDPAFSFESDATEIHVLVTEWDCHGFASADGRIARHVQSNDNGVVISLAVRSLAGAQECPGTPPTPYVIRLDEPLGSRLLFDGGYWPPQLIATGLTPTPTGPPVDVQQVGPTRIYTIGVGAATWTEPSTFQLPAGHYYINGQCSGTDRAFGQAVFRLEQVQNGAIVGEPVSIRCGPTETVQAFGEIRRLVEGSYRLVLESNAGGGITIEIGSDTAAPALPVGQVAPRSPANPLAGRVAVACPGEAQQREKSPCVFFDLHWTGSDETSSYRIYESWEQVGTPVQPCDPATAELIVATTGASEWVTTGIYVPATGSGGLCLYVAAVNSAGESARVQFAGVVLTGEPASGPSAGQTFQVHRAQSGDTLSDIATKYGISYEQLLAANPQIADPNHILVGQPIYIPWADWVPRTPAPDPTYTPYP